MKCHIVDVFAETRFAGNQLAVVLDCEHLSSDAMQDIAREMNFSETTFVIHQSEDEARVRIFTPERELSFAGHPTIGTAWVLGRDMGVYTLDLDAGRVPVSFAEDGVAWMVPPQVDLGEPIVPALAARLVGLSEADIHPDFPCRYAVVGPRFALIGLTSLDVLKRAAVNVTTHAEMAGGDFFAVFVFTPETHEFNAQFAARMFFSAQGFREDPATGSANTAFAAHLRSLGRTGSFTVEQGFEIKRPSHLYLDVGDVIRVGGRVQPVLEGEMLFDSE
ncbi:MAG: PhzF family phenazine biosynthesis protein [Gammaproteobacteria bacterium]|nr:PhzF family phenazine biosynthesis protein [Gammaproteobacteria bacterium]